MWSSSIAGCKRRQVELTKKLRHENLHGNLDMDIKHSEWAVWIIYKSADSEGIRYSREWEYLPFLKGRQNV